MVRKIVRNFLIFIILTAWFLAGWPRVWQNPPIPPEIQEIRAADTGYNPAAGNVDGGWVNEANAYSDDTNNATLTGTTGTSQWTTFGLGGEIPGSATITAISVQIQCETTKVQGKSGDLTDIELSWNGGSNWTSTADAQSDCATSDTDYYFPDTTGDLWGRGSWTVSEFSDANFQVKVTGDASEKATIVLGIDIIQVKVAYTVPADLTWNTAAADFKIYPASSGILTWNDTTDGAAVCTATLNDDNGQTVSCDSGAIAASTQYRVQVVLKNVGGTAVNMQGSSEYVDHKNVKGGWAGTNPTLGNCAFQDLDGGDATNACAVGWNATNDVRVTQTRVDPECAPGPCGVIVNTTSGQEGFMYLITTDSDVPSSNSTSYFDTSIDSVTEDSSKITITGPAAVSVSVSDGVITYGTMQPNTSKTTLSGELNDMQTATNNGGATANFNIKGQNATGGGCTWTLAATSDPDQYVHQFCNDTDNDCSSPPTNYTALSIFYNTLKTGIAVDGTVDFQLRLTTPNPSSCSGEQTVDVTVQAVAQ